MKAALTALALACAFAQTFSVQANAEQYVSRTNTSAGTFAISSLPFAGFRSAQRSVSLSNEACALINAGQFEQAEGKLRQAISLDPNLVSAHCNLGLVLNKTGRAQEAIEHLEFAHKRNPDQPAALETLAAAYQLTGNFDKAITLYTQYLSQFPGAADATLVADIMRHLKKESQDIASRGGTYASSKNFHWNKKVVKVFIQPANGLRNYSNLYNQVLQESFLSWSQSGDLAFEFVDSLAKADIECVWTDNVANLSSPGEGGEAVLRHQGPVVTHARITLLTNRPGTNMALNEREIRALCLHEIGHSLGIMEHSARPDDVMFCTLSSAEMPTPHDFQNLSSLYQLAKQ